MSDNVLLDPTNESEPALREPAARLAVLEGAKVGLLDISKARGDVFLDHLERRLGERKVEVLRFRKPTFSKVAPMDVRQQISERCDAVIEALAD